MKFLRSLVKRLLTRQSNQVRQKNNQDKTLSKSVRKNMQTVKELFGESEDVIIRRFTIGAEQRDAFLLHIDGMTDKNFIGENVMKPLMALNLAKDKLPFGLNDTLSYVEESILAVGEIKQVKRLEELLANVLSGDTALFLEGSDSALVISTRSYPNRGVQEPDTEAVVRGPREGFTEPLRINTTLLRRKIKNPNLRFETFTIGKQSHTNVSIVYLKGVCDQKIITEIKKRLSRIDTDAIFGAGTIEQFINDSPLSPFATIGNTERPDVAAGRIMEGRAAIIIDGTPIVLTVPHLFIEGFQTVDDYLTKPTYATVVRWLRYLAFSITTLIPSLYIALTTFHQEMIPTRLLMTMAGAREGVPFPAIVEALAMGATFELIREAGIRMPRPVGQAVSIVGALVIGEAAVAAGLVGAPMVIITALTAITSFIIPALVDVTTLLRFGFTLLAGAAGLYGIMLGILVTLIHMVSLRSFGIPYLSPLAPITFRDLKDVLIKPPVWAMDTRPRVVGYKNERRQGRNNRPAPPKKRQ